MGGILVVHCIYIIKFGEVQTPKDFRLPQAYMAQKLCEYICVQRQRKTENSYNIIYLLLYTYNNNNLYNLLIKSLLCI